MRAKSVGAQDPLVTLIILFAASIHAIIDPIIINVSQEDQEMKVNRNLYHLLEDIVEEELIALRR